MNLTREQCEIRFLSITEVERRTTLEFSFIKKLVLSGKFPIPRNIDGASHIGWISYDIEEWILSRPPRDL